VTRRPARMTADEVAAHLSLSRAELDELRAQGDAPMAIVGADGEHLTRPADLARWIDAHTVRPLNQEGA
jgi:hypothetical protein